MKKYYIRVRTTEQLEAVVKWGKADALFADCDTWIDDRSDLQKIITSGIPEIYFCLPEITRQSKKKLSEDMIAVIPENSGVLARTPDQLEMLIESGFKGPVVGDSFLYTCNSQSIKLYRELIPGIMFISPDELTDTEMEMTGEDFIYKAYGHQALMVTNQCLMKNYNGCREGLVWFKNEKKDRFFALNRCRQCSSVIYDSRVINMLDRLDEAAYDRILLDMTIESASQTYDILTQAEGKSVAHADTYNEVFIRGHHYKGVE